MKRRVIALTVFVTLAIVLSIGYFIHEQIVTKQQSEIENNSRNNYIRQSETTSNGGKYH